MLKIGDFSKLSKISIYMLRHYDKLGLLVPAHIDEDSGYRYYEEKQLTIANRIQALKAMGLGLNEIKDVIYQYRDNQSLADFLKIETAKKRKLAEDCLLYTSKRLGLASHLLDRAYYEVYGHRSEDFASECGSMAAPKSRLVRKSDPKKATDVRSKFKMGDSVLVLPEKEIGIVYKPVSYTHLN